VNRASEAHDKALDDLLADYESRSIIPTGMLLVALIIIGRILVSILIRLEREP